MTSATKNPIGAFPPVGRGSEPSLVVVPKPSPVFPQSTKPAPIGGLVGAGVVTPRELLLKQSSSFQVGRFLLPAGSLLAGYNWKKLEVDRPTVIISLTTEAPGAVDGTRHTCSLLYNYGKVPDDFNLAQRGRGGIAFLSQPGPWYIAANPPDFELGAQSLDCVILDGDAVETAARLFRDPGNSGQLSSNTVLTDATVATAFGSTDRYLRGITLQNVTTAAGASQTIRYSVGMPVTYLVSAGAWTGRGFRLLVNGSVTFEADVLTRAPIYVVMEAAGTTAIEQTLFSD